MGQEEINVLVESPNHTRTYNEKFKPCPKEVFGYNAARYLHKKDLIAYIGNKIKKDLGSSSEDITDYRIDSGEKNLNDSFRKLFGEQRKEILIKQQEPFYEWNNVVGGRLGLLIGAGATTYSYFAFGADCATDIANSLNNFSKNLAFFTGLVQTGISFAIPLATGLFTYLSSEKIINSVGNKYSSLKNKYSKKAKNHEEKLKNDIELYGKLEQAVVD